MEIKTKYDLGQMVYGVGCCSEQIKEPCQVCGGKGSIELNGKSYECPECYGDGYKSHLTAKNWHIVANSHIGKVSVEIIKGHYVEYYMLNSTGVGSGSLWHRDLLFATKKDAEAECAKRNENASPYNYSCSVDSASNETL